jgi:hypothetical protein
VTIRNCWFKNSGQVAIQVVGGNAGTSEVRIENNLIENFAGSAIQVGACDGIYINNNSTIGRGVETYHQISVQGPGRIVISDNLVYKHNNFGITVFDFSPGLEIKRNSCIDGGLEAINVSANIVSVKGFAIIDNYIDNPTVAHTDGGVVIFSVGALTMSEGAVKDNFIRKRGLNGVAVIAYDTATMRDIEVAQNHIIDCGQATITAGVILLTAAAGATVQRNIVRDNTMRSTDARMSYGVQEFGAGTTDFNYVYNNMAIGAATARVSILGANSQESGNGFPV